MPLNIVFFEASKSVSTKTLLLKHYYHREGKRGFVQLKEGPGCCYRALGPPYGAIGSP